MTKLTEEQRRALRVLSRHSTGCAEGSLRAHGFSVEQLAVLVSRGFATPAVRIEGELYWDGGILSNTPTEAIFDDDPRRNSLIFAVHMWNPSGPEPGTIWEVLHRQEDIQYSSRIANHIARQREAHRLRHVINELVKCVPDDARKSAMVRELAAYGCPTRMHVVRLLAPRLGSESHIKDIDFSPSGIRSRWQAGYADTCRALARAPWIGEFGPLDAVVLHEPNPDEEDIGKIRKLGAASSGQVSVPAGTADLPGRLLSSRA